jgi:protein LTV1
MRGDLGVLGGEDFDASPAGEVSSQCGPHRPGAPAMNDADFSEFLDREYADDEIGECEGVDLEGPVDLEEHEEILDEYIQGKADEQEKLISINEPKKGKHEKDDGIRTLEETRAIIEKHYLGEEADEDETSLGSESPDESRTWDCESVLSTLSNLSNRPGRIATIKVAKKPGNPLKPVKEAADTAEGSDEGEEDVVDLPDVNTTRRRGETAEERRERKAGVKEMRRICRKMKKDSKDTYKEASKTPTQPGSGDLRGKLRTFRLS